MPEDTSGLRPDGGGGPEPVVEGDVFLGAGGRGRGRDGARLVGLSAGAIAPGPPNFVMSTPHFGQARARASVVDPQRGQAAMRAEEYRIRGR